MNFLAKLVLGMIKNLLGMKLIWIIVIAVVVLIVIFLIKNIVKGSFDVAKFAGGFNVFSGQVQGKLIYYFIIFSIVAAVALGIYAKFTDDTYSNTYKNNISNNNEVYVDQRQIIESQEDTLMIGIKLFGLKIGLTAKGHPKSNTTIDNKKVTGKIIVSGTNPPAPIKVNPTSDLKKSLYVLGASFVGLLVIIFGTHFITKLFKKEKK